MPTPTSASTSTPEIHSENYRFLQEHVHSQSGIVLEGDKHYLFENRLGPIVKRLGLDSINDLCALLRAPGRTEISRQVVEAMTTNETYFFREPAHYEAIRTVLLPHLKEERRDTKKLRIWSAAASTGQEAYSTAMLMLEENLADWNMQILGTDFPPPRLLWSVRPLRQILPDRGEPGPSREAASQVLSTHRRGLAVERRGAPDGAL